MGEIKQAYIAELEQRLSDWHVDLRKLQARMEKANVDAGHQLYIEIHELRQKRDKTKIQLEELREVEHEEWQHLKEALDNGWHHLTDLLKQVGKGFEQEFKSK